MLFQFFKMALLVHHSSPLIDFRNVHFVFHVLLHSVASLFQLFYFKKESIENDNEPKLRRAFLAKKAQRLKMCGLYLYINILSIVWLPVATSWASSALPSQTELSSARANGNRLSRAKSRLCQSKQKIQAAVSSVPIPASQSLGYCCSFFFFFHNCITSLSSLFNQFSYSNN